MAYTTASCLEEGDAVFYGVRAPWLHLWEQAKRERRTWYYVDNAYFDREREERFRIGRNCVQPVSFPLRDYARIDRVIQPWRADGDHVLVCVQSDEYMRVVEGWVIDWARWVCDQLSWYTRRRVVVRLKGDRIPLQEALCNAWACVAHTSASANEALLAGVPVCVTGQCVARPMSCELSDIEEPLCMSGRLAWASAVAAHQWTLAQLASGKAWSMLHA